MTLYPLPDTFNRCRLLRKARSQDKGSYERTQFRGPYGKARRNVTRYSRRFE